MATITINSLPAIVVAADTNDNELVINAPMAKDDRSGGLEFSVEVRVGNIQFAAGAVVSAENPIFASGEKAIISLSENTKLNFKAGAASDSFIISR